MQWYRSNCQSSETEKQLYEAEECLRKLVSKHLPSMKSQATSFLLEPVREPDSSPQIEAIQPAAVETPQAKSDLSMQVASLLEKIAANEYSHDPGVKLDLLLARTHRENFLKGTLGSLHMLTDCDLWSGTGDTPMKFFSGSETGIRRTYHQDKKRPGKDRPTRVNIYCSSCHTYRRVYIWDETKGEWDQAEEGDIGVEHKQQCIMPEGPHASTPPLDTQLVLKWLSDEGFVFFPSKWREVADLLGLGWDETTVSAEMCSVCRNGSTSVPYH